MGNLSHLVEGQRNIRARLDAGEQLAQSRAVDVEAIVARQFEGVTTGLQAELRRLSEQSRNAHSESYSGAIQQSMLTVTQILQQLLNSLSNLSTEADKNTKGLKGDIGKVATSKELADLEKQILALGLQVDALPKEFKQKDVDFSGLQKDIQMIKKSVDSIKMPEMPKTVDVTPQLKAMEKRMGKRVVEFDIVRDQFGMMTKIIAKEGDI